MISTRTIKREKCKFCGKELEQKTMSFIVGDREFVLSGEPVRCGVKIDFGHESVEML